MCISGLVAQELSVSGAGPGAQGCFRNYLAFLICTGLISSSQPFGAMPGIQDLSAILMPQLLLETCITFPLVQVILRYFMQIISKKPQKAAFSVLPSNASRQPQKSLYNLAKQGSLWGGEVSFSWQKN